MLAPPPGEGVRGAMWSELPGPCRPSCAWGGRACRGAQRGAQAGRWVGSLCSALRLQLLPARTNQPFPRTGERSAITVASGPWGEAALPSRGAIMGEDSGGASCDAICCLCWQIGTDLLSPNRSF